ncbi:HAD-superfamily hydrolase subfamily IA, variant 3 [Rubrobacter xylanophilus DSM 9941]|uniref:HAD-superfamily hydrolase subfamily IA, variant 3 n=1 Tax=Rubrobacter xylanophilus (strain DSM 9941 / JCM 11954 / NBRC 16129 / PRD-1) TaxID=266117 RepID=Q1AU83_RUBXD|nr:HAD family phosphatase [Rubrobacter xylanophilus]ABG05045.1 HAD-superfamily hydrolase subfamily IA, variant 3 [Rubrobacter xylanophilus DSM 9941]
MVRALLFDLDGTLAETDSVHYPAWAGILASHGYEADWGFYQERISGRLNPEIAAELLPQLSEEERRRIIEAKEEDFRRRVGELEPLPGLVRFVERAREGGRRVALVTNAPRENALAVLRALGLEGCFDPVVLAEDAGAGKPDPAPYRRALRLLGVAPGEAVAFEDSPSGLRAAVAAGVPVVGVASTHDPSRLEALGAFMVVEDFTDPRLGALLDGRGGGARSSGRGAGREG